jgi:predicted AAA+ superfamily ATPase
MIFVAGPRQSGKTTLAHIIGKGFDSSTYFNWDIATDRKKLKAAPYFYESLDRPRDQPALVIFDEIHKFSGWKNYLKGAYDRDQGKFKFLITGSGRLDTYRKGGDSLAGRYFLVHVWPFTLAELAESRIPHDEFIGNPLICPTSDPQTSAEIWQRLSERSGFPTPYLAKTPEIYRVWSETYRNQLVREDVRNIEHVVKIDQLEGLVDLLPLRVGSPLSLNNLAGDIGVSFDTVKSWLNVLDRFFLTFRIAPYASKVTRAITKEQKLYLFDYAQIDDPAARFENMVALELYRAVSTWNERGLGRYQLTYVRNRDKEECDFLLTDKRRPICLIETKLSDTAVSKSLLKFQDQLAVPAVQLVTREGTRRRIKNGDHEVLVVSAWDWLRQLP